MSLEKNFDTTKLVGLIKSDLYRYEGRVSKISFIRAYFRRPGFKFSFWMRICGTAYKYKWARHSILPLLDIIFDHYRYKFGFDIPYTLQIGPGLLIYHFGGIVFNPASCGKNATISQNTTVGMRIYNGKKIYPIIKDNVYLAPGAKIIGDVVVENNTAIGTNAVLTHSTHINEVVVGIPAKVISTKGSAEYINYPI